MCANNILNIYLKVYTVSDLLNAQKYDSFSHIISPTIRQFGHLHIWSYVANNFSTQLLFYDIFLFNCHGKHVKKFFNLFSKTYRHVFIFLQIILHYIEKHLSILYQDTKVRFPNIYYIRPNGMLIYISACRNIRNIYNTSI